MEKKKEKTLFLKFKNWVENIIYLLVLIPLSLITLSIVIQSIAKPDEIPNIFGRKMFIVTENYLNSSVENGDLIVTKNIDADKLKKNDVIAFKNSNNKISVNKISSIEYVENDEGNNEKLFVIKTVNNEISYVKASKVEGLIIHQIGQLGFILYIIQKPSMTIGLICIVSIIGLVWYYISQIMDEKEMKKEKNISKSKENSNNEA